MVVNSFLLRLAMTIEVQNHPPRWPNTGLFRTVFVIELLGDRSATNFDIDDIALAMNGDFSGKIELLDEREVKRETMHDLLVNQESDPSFLLGEHSDVYAIKVGDRIKWHDPDNGLTSREIIVTSIEFSPHDSAIFINDELECLADEIEIL